MRNYWDQHEQICNFFFFRSDAWKLSSRHQIIYEFMVHNLIDQQACICSGMEADFYMRVNSNVLLFKGRIEALNLTET